MIDCSKNAGWIYSANVSKLSNGAEFEAYLVTTDVLTSLPLFCK